MGLSPKEIDGHREAILEFSEIGAFINTPVQYYSSGITARLAFAIAFCVKPDILLLDEVFAVGDEAFRKKCTQHLEKLCATGRTIIIASHAASSLRQLRTRAICLETARLEWTVASMTFLIRIVSARNWLQKRHRLLAMYRKRF